VSAEKHRHLVEQAARTTWGQAWPLLSAEQRAGALALASLNHIAAQDESMPAEKVRAIALDLHALVATTSRPPTGGAS
jgi:hypothetical protein